MENKDQKGSVKQPRSEMLNAIYGICKPVGGLDIRTEEEKVACKHIEELASWENQTLAEARAIHDRNRDNEEVSILIHSQE